MNAEETRKKMLVCILGTNSYEADVCYEKYGATETRLLTFPQLLLNDTFHYDRIWLVGTSATTETAKKISELLGAETCRFWELSSLANEAECWREFKRFAEALPAEAEEGPWDIDLDLTNGIRSQQIFLQEVIRFYCDLNERSFRLAKAHYGFLTKAEDRKQDENATPNKGKTSYYDMTAIIELKSMTSCINDFLKNNQADGLVKLLGKLCEIQSDNPKEKEFLETMRVIQKATERFSNVVAMNITPMAADVIRQLCGAIERLQVKAMTEKSGALYPFVEAMQHLHQELHVHLPEDAKPLWGWQLALSKWCLDRKLYQQAATQADELVTTKFAETYAVNKLGKTPDEAIQYALDYKDVRDPMSTYICNHSESYGAKKNSGNYSPYCGRLNSLINRNDENCIVKLRNNLNHAFMKQNEIDIESQKRKIVDCVNGILNLMKDEDIPADFMDGYDESNQLAVRENAIEKKMKKVIKSIINSPVDDMELIQKIKDFIAAQSNGTAKK
ncbi:MAG: hypothetical protein ACI4WT_10570 [Oligosphaeraceae bacterium]